MSYSKSLLVRNDFKRAEFERFIDESANELHVVFYLLDLLDKVGTIDRRTAVTLKYNYDCKIALRRNDFLERTKDEILAT